VLDSDGKRIFAKYYNESKFATLKEQSAFEQLLWAKTRKSSGEVALIENYVVLSRDAADARIYFIGSASENELIIFSALNAYYEAVCSLLRDYVDKRTILENLDYVILALDEVIDGGIILEVDPEEIVSRVSMTGSDPDSLPISEQSIGAALSSARQQIARTLLN